MEPNTITIEPHGPCSVVREHGREWAVCNTCGAQWALHGSQTEEVSAGDGYCVEHKSEGV
jgi:hypothetical protein